MYQLPQVSNDLTKSQIKVIAQTTIDSILESGNVIEVADTFAKIELFIKEIKSASQYIDYLRDEVAKHGKGITTSSGTKIELAEVGTKYDYSNCGDSQIDELMKQLEILEMAIKERQTFLKTIPSSGMEVILEGGEICKIYPPSKTSTSSVKTTIAK